MNGFKKLISVFAPLLILTLTVCVLFGCTNAAAESIFVETKNLPKTVYVEGEELDLEDGVITVTTKKGDNNYVPMTDGSVSVSGYNKDTIGKQNVTLTYDGKTATVEVEVIPRLIVEGYEENYFVGEKLDFSKGKIRVAKGGGSRDYNTYNFNNGNVSFNSYDFSKAGAAEVTAVYTVGSKSYEKSFTVTVHEVAGVNFKAPTRNSYKSHEDKIDLLGGYFNVTSKTSGFSKYVDLSTASITGFDPSLATTDNIDTPLTQTVSFTYAGETFSFDITVSYSEIFIIEDTAKLLSKIDWSADNPEIPEEDGNAAVKAIMAYFKLSDSEKKLLDYEDVITCLRPAVVVVNTLYTIEGNSFSNAFTIDSNGYITVVADELADMVNAVERLGNKNDPYNVYATLARQILENFASETIKGKITVGDYLRTHSDETVGEIISLFEHMIDVYKNLENIPDNWTVESLPLYEEDITFAATDIIMSQYKGASYTPIYYTVSSWRTNDDYFEIIYTYYFHHRENGKEEIVELLWGKVPAPGILGEWYNAYIDALYQEQLMEYNVNSGAYLYDTSTFMYNYSRVLEISEKVLSEGDELSREIYKLVGCEYLVANFLRGATFGYIFQMGEALDYERVVLMWNEYIALLNSGLFNTPNDITPYGEDIEKIFNSLMALSPAELHAFLSSMNFLYDTSMGTIMILDYEKTVYSRLVYLIALHYEEVLPEAVAPLLRKMLLAAENLSLVGEKSDAIDSFKGYMSDIKNAYDNVLTDAERDAFDKYLGTAYKAYAPLYENALNNGAISFGGMDDVFAELDSWLDRFDEIMQIISTTEDEATLQRLVPLAIAIYERASAEQKAILASKNSTAINAFYTKLYTKENVEYTLDSRFFGAREIVVSLLISSAIADANGNAVMAWDIYSGASDEVREFIVSALPLMYAQYKGDSFDGDIYKLAEAFRLLSATDKQSFYLIGINILYYEAIEATVEKNLTEGNKVEGLINRILNLEIAYAVYKSLESEENLNTFLETANEVEALLTQIKDEANRDKYLLPLYSYYLDEAEKLGK